MAQQVSGQKQQGEYYMRLRRQHLEPENADHQIRAANAVFQLQGHPSEYRLSNRQCRTRSGRAQVCDETFFLFPFGAILAIPIPVAIVVLISTTARRQLDHHTTSS